MKKSLAAITTIAFITGFMAVSEARKVKMSYEQAKMECQEDFPGISGKSLKKCIKKKQMQK